MDLQTATTHVAVDLQRDRRVDVELPYPIEVGVDETLSVAVGKMRAPRLDNVAADLMTYQWKLLTYDNAGQRVDRKNIFSGVLGVGYYESVADVLREMVNRADSILVAELGNRVVNVADLIHVNVYGELVKLETNVLAGLELYEGYPGHRGRITLHVSQPLLDLLCRCSGDHSDHMRLNLHVMDSECFDNAHSSLCSEPLIHVMMDHLERPHLMPKPVLYTFPRCKQLVFEPYQPRFVSFDARLVNTVTLWLENAWTGQLVGRDGDKLHLELIWKRTPRT